MRLHPWSLLLLLLIVFIACPPAITHTGLRKHQLESGGATRGTRPEVEWKVQEESTAGGRGGGGGAGGRGDRDVVCPAQCRVWRLSVLVCGRTETIHLQQLSRCLRLRSSLAELDLNFSSPFCNCTMLDFLGMMSSANVLTFIPPACSLTLLHNCSKDKIVLKLTVWKLWVPGSTLLYRDQRHGQRLLLMGVHVNNVVRHTGRKRHLSRILRKVNTLLAAAARLEYSNRPGQLPEDHARRKRDKGKDHSPDKFRIKIVRKKTGDHAEKNTTDSEPKGDNKPDTETTTLASAEENITGNSDKDDGKKGEETTGKTDKARKPGKKKKTTIVSIEEEEEENTDDDKGNEKEKEKNKPAEDVVEKESSENEIVNIEVDENGHIKSNAGKNSDGKSSEGEGGTEVKESSGPIMENPAEKDKEEGKSEAEEGAGASENEKKEEETGKKEEHKNKEEDQKGNKTEENDNSKKENQEEENGKEEDKEKENGKEEDKDKENGKEEDKEKENGKEENGKEEDKDKENGKEEDKENGKEENKNRESTEEEKNTGGEENKEETSKSEDEGGKEKKKEDEGDKADKSSEKEEKNEENSDTKELNKDEEKENMGEGEEIKITEVSEVNMQDEAENRTDGDSNHTNIESEKPKPHKFHLKIVDKTTKHKSSNDTDNEERGEKVRHKDKEKKHKQKNSEEKHVSKQGDHNSHEVHHVHNDKEHTTDRYKTSESKPHGSKLKKEHVKLADTEGHNGWHKISIERKENSQGINRNETEGGNALDDGRTEEPSSAGTEKETLTMKVVDHRHETDEAVSEDTEGDVSDDEQQADYEDEEDEEQSDVGNEDEDDDEDEAEYEGGGKDSDEDDSKTSDVDDVEEYDSRNHLDDLFNNTTESERIRSIKDKHEFTIRNLLRPDHNKRKGFPKAKQERQVIDEDIEAVHNLLNEVRVFAFSPDYGTSSNSVSEDESQDSENDGDPFNTLFKRSVPEAGRHGRHKARRVAAAPDGVGDTDIVITQTNNGTDIDTVQHPPEGGHGHDKIQHLHLDENGRPTLTGDIEGGGESHAHEEKQPEEEKANVDRKSGKGSEHGLDEQASLLEDVLFYLGGALTVILLAGLFFLWRNMSCRGREGRKSVLERRFSSGAKGEEEQGLIAADQAAEHLETSSKTMVNLESETHGLGDAEAESKLPVQASDSEKTETTTDDKSHKGHSDKKHKGHSDKKHKGHSQKKHKGHGHKKKEEKDKEEGETEESQEGEKKEDGSKKHSKKSESKTKNSDKHKKSSMKSKDKHKRKKSKDKDKKHSSRGKSKGSGKGKRGKRSKSEGGESTKKGRKGGSKRKRRSRSQSRSWSTGKRSRTPRGRNSNAGFDSNASNLESQETESCTGHISSFPHTTQTKTFPESEKPHSVLMDGPFLSAVPWSDRAPRVSAWVYSSAQKKAMHSASKHHRRPRSKPSTRKSVPSKTLAGSSGDGGTRSTSPPASGSHQQRDACDPRHQRAAGSSARERQTELRGQASLGSMVVAWARRCDAMERQQRH